MKKIYKDKILNIEGTDTFDNTFLFEYLISPNTPILNPFPSEEKGAAVTSLLGGETERGVVGKDVNIEIIYLKDLLEPKKNEEILEKVKQKPAMWSEVYSPKDELEIFAELFENALKNKKKIHIVGVTLGEEIQMLETYYEKLGFMREDINAFNIDFSVPLVTVSCHIENLIWRGSDYKAQRENIFFCPPVRESGQNKALFKGITRGVIAGIELGEFSSEKQEFIGDCIRQEKILPLHMGKVLKYNLEDMGFQGREGELKVKY